MLACTGVGVAEGLSMLWRGPSGSGRLAGNVSLVSENIFIQSYCNYSKSYYNITNLKVCEDG